MSCVEVGLQRGVDHPAADFRAGRVERGDVLDVQRGEAVEDALVQVVVGDEGLEGVGGGREAAGHGDAELGQVADHLAERGVLAADLRQVGQSQLVQPEDVGAQGGAPGAAERGGRRAIGRGSPASKRGILRAPHCRDRLPR